MKPFIDQAFWSDPDIEAQSAGVKLCALWLFTNSQTSLLGLCSASASRFTFETRLPPTALEKTIAALPRAFIKVGGTIFVRNYVRHQFGAGDKLMRNNFFVALKSQIAAIKDEELRMAVLKEYPEFTQALGKPLGGLTKPKGREGKDREGKERTGKVFSPPSLEEVKAYASEISFPADEIQDWMDHFASNGWRVGGRAPMKDWKAALRTAKKRKQQSNGNNNQRRPAESSRNIGTANEGRGGDYANAPGVIRSTSPALSDPQRPDA